MSYLTGEGSSSFAPLSGEEVTAYGTFNDIEVNGNIYLKESTDQYTGYNAPLITVDKSNDDMIFNTTTLNSNWDFTVGTGQDTKESILKINPTTGLSFDAGSTPYNISWNELSYLNGAKSNIQTQIDNLDPDLSSNQGYWGNFSNNTTLTNPVANAVNIVPFPTADPNNYAITVQNSSRITLAHAGIYMFIATIQIQKNQSGSSSDSQVFFWIRQNGVDIADSAFKNIVRKEPVLLTANWQLKMQDSDYFQLVWSSDDTAVELLYLPAGSTPTKPAIPAVILTASQVSFLVSGGAGLLPLTYSSATNMVKCDASFQVVGTLDVSGNTRLRGNIDISGVLTTTNNVFASGSRFNYNKNVETITVQNALWTDGSGATPSYNNYTTMFSDVKNATITLHGWTWSGTAISTINGFNGVWMGDGASDFNHYGSPPPNSGKYYAFFECYSPGTNQANSTFYFQKELTLDVGFYIADWWSWWGAGTQYTTTSLSVSVGSGPSLLTYNDSDTRSTLIWKARTLLFEVKTAGSNPLRWTYRDTQSTSNRFFNASIGNLRIKKYSGITVSDASYTSLIAGSLANLQNTTMNGTNSINGTLTMSGIPTFFSSKGVSNVCLSTSFTQATLATNCANNIAIGGIAFYAETFTDCVLIGQNSMTNTSQQQKSGTRTIGIGNEIYGPSVNDVVIGYGARKTFDAGADNCVLIGALIGENAGSRIPFTRCVAIGSQLWRGYYSGTSTPPVENVAIGYGVQSLNTDGFFGSFNTAIGSYSQAYIAGNASVASYNTSIGYYSGVDVSGITHAAFRQPYYGCTYLGAWARSKGNVANIRYATSIGFNSSADASYCTVIGADASYNVANSIRLGRPEDTTVVSHLTVNGITTLSGNTTVGNLSVTGSVTGLSFTSLSLSGNLAVGGNLDISGNTVLGTSGTNRIQAKSNFINRGDGWAIATDGGGVYISSGQELKVDCGTEGGVNYGVYNLVSYIKARDQICYDRGTEGLNRANEAYDHATDVGNDANAYTTAAVAALTAEGGALFVLEGEVSTLQGELLELAGTVGELSGTVGDLETDMTVQQSKTQYMLPVSGTFSTSRFYNNISIYETANSLAYSIYLSPTTTSTFSNGLECNALSTLAGNVQNIRGSTVNIADSGGAANIDCTSVSLGNVASSSIQIGDTTSTLTANVGTLTLGNTSASNVKIGASNSNITIGGLSSSIYINGFLYIPFNPANFATALAQWT